MTVFSGGSQARLQEELSALAAERARLLELVSSTEGKDAADQAERTMREFDVEQLDVRIRRVEDKLDAVSRPRADTQHDGTVREGEVVLLDFGDGVAERYVVSSIAAVDDDVDVITPTSPLGRALLGGVAGQEVDYRTPQGHRTVRVVAVGESAEPVSQAS